MTNQSHNTRAFPNLHNMTSADVGDAMRERAIALKSKLTPDQAQAVDILVEMAGQVSAMAEGLVTDIGKAALVADLYSLDELLPA
jgi:hypothetical protein